MREELRNLFFDAAKVTVVAAFTFLVAPWVEALLPEKTDPVLLYVISTFGTAVALVALYMFVFARAHLQLDWTRDGDEHLLSEIDAEIYGTSRESARSYWVRITRGRSFGIGALALAIGCRTGLQIKVEGIHGQLIIVPEEQDWSDGDGDCVRSLPGCAMIIDLRKPSPARDHVWTAARVRFAGRRPGQQRTSTLRHTATGDRLISKLCGRLVRVDAKAATVIERWS